MNKRTIWTIRVSAVSAGLSLLAGAMLFGDPGKPTEPKYTAVKYSADASSYKWEGNDKVLVLKGNVKFVHGDTTMTSDRVDYRESAKTATATGHLKIVNEESTITGNQCVLGFKDKKGTISGDVKMVSKPKPGSPKGKSSIRDEVTVTCAAIDYFYKEKKAVSHSTVTIVQKDRHLTADSGTYFGRDDKVELVGNVHGMDDKDRHTFNAPKVRISLKDDDQWMEADKATGSFYIQDEDDNESGKPSEKSPEKPVDKSKGQPVK